MTHEDLIAWTLTVGVIGAGGLLAFGYAAAGWIRRLNRWRRYAAIHRRVRGSS